MATKDDLPSSSVRKDNNDPTIVVAEIVPLQENIASNNSAQETPTTTPVADVIVLGPAEEEPKPATTEETAEAEFELPEYIRSSSDIGMEHVGMEQPQQRTDGDYSSRDILPSTEAIPTFQEEEEKRRQRVIFRGLMFGVFLAALFAVVLAVNAEPPHNEDDDLLNYFPSSPAPTPFPSYDLRTLSTSLQPPENHVVSTPTLFAAKIPPPYSAPTMSTPTPAAAVTAMNAVFSAPQSHTPTNTSNDERRRRRGQLSDLCSNLVLWAFCLAGNVIQTFVFGGVAK